jgi:hypothetical protein
MMEQKQIPDKNKPPIILEVPYSNFYLKVLHVSLSISNKPHLNIWNLGCGNNAFSYYTIISSFSTLGFGFWKRR